ncbi:MAG: alpha/beta fold hydrolase [Planctomycetota bacterium]|nr:alpha/beta fold hydrolase [Planctomycetota bacterium]MDA1212558.1 alpha/beta fold hydrolase [Planctomycetota bacterium]
MMNTVLTRSMFFASLLFFVSVVHGEDAISRSEQLPETTPWDLEALSIPPDFEWVDETSPVQSLFYAGEPYDGHPTRVFAYYATPGTLAGDTSNDGHLPAVVLVHGGGGTAFREWAELWAKRGYAAIAMDLAGHRPIEGKNAHQRENRTPLEEGGPNQGDDEKFGSIGKPPEEQWPYHAVASVLRAHSLIRSFPEVDANRTAVTGISWGGYLTCIVAGVDSRFKAAVPVYGCGFLGDNSAWVDRLSKMTDDERNRWLELWDPSRYLPAVSMPILFVNGTNDFAYPLDSYKKSYDLVTGEKRLRITVKMPHGHPPGWAPEEIGLFVDQHLRDGISLTHIGPMAINDGRVQIVYQSDTKLTKAELHYTTGSEPVNMREWETIQVKWNEAAVVFDVLPETATAWFITVTDERGAIVSGEVILNEKPEN